MNEYESNYDPPSGAWRRGSSIDYGSVELEVGRILHSLVSLVRPRVVLETGTYKGYSTCCMASALELIGEGVVYTIDSNPESPLWSGSSLEKFIVPIRKSSVHAAKLFDDVNFNLLFFDSDHHYETVLEEIRLYEPKLVVGGIIVMHDTLFYDGVGAALKQLISLGRFECVTLDTPRRHFRRCTGLSIIRKMKEGDPVSYNPKFSGWFIGNARSDSYLRKKSISLL